jgi:hypothetical protein
MTHVAIKRTGRQRKNVQEAMTLVGTSAADVSASDASAAPMSNSVDERHDEAVNSAQEAEGRPIRTRGRPAKAYTDMEEASDDGSPTEAEACDTEFSPVVDEPVKRKRGRPRRGEERRPKPPPLEVPLFKPDGTPIYKRGRPRKDDDRPRKPRYIPQPAKLSTMTFDVRIQRMLQDPRYKIRMKEGGKTDHLIGLYGPHQDVQQMMDMRLRQGYDAIGPDRRVIRQLSKLPTLRPCALHALASKQVIVAVGKADLDAYLPVDSTQTVFFVSSRASVIEPIEATLETGQSHRLYEKDPLSTSVTINTGLDNKTVAWLPSANATQYFAVGGSLPLQTPDPLYKYKTEPGCVQLWRSTRSGNAMECHLDSVIAHDFGVCYDLKWMPLAVNSDQYHGLLAGCFGSGQVIGFFVERHTSESTSYSMLTTPAFNLAMDDHPITCFDWQGTTSIAVGCDDGFIASFDLSKPPHPSLGYLPRHVANPQSCYITHIVSCKPLLPKIVATNAYDCEAAFTDLSGASGAGGQSVSLLRSRTMCYAFAWSNLTGCLISTDESGMGVRMSPPRGECSSSTLADRLPALITAAACVQPLLNDEAEALPGIAEHASHPIIAAGDASGQVWLYNTHVKLHFPKKAKYKRLVCAAQYIAQVNPKARELLHEDKPIDSSMPLFDPGYMVFLEGWPMAEYQAKAVDKKGNSVGIDEDDDVDEEEVIPKAKKSKGKKKAESGVRQGGEDDEYEPNAQSKGKKAKNGGKQPATREANPRQVYHNEVMVRALAWNPNLMTTDGKMTSAIWSGVLATAYKSFVRIEDVGME